MADKILEIIYQAYLEKAFKEQSGIRSSFDFEDSSLAYLNYLCSSDMQVTVKIKKGNSVSEEKYFMSDIISFAITHGEEVGFKNGFLIGMLFGDQINGKTANFNCKN